MWTFLSYVGTKYILFLFRMFSCPVIWGVTWLNTAMAVIRLLVVKEWAHTVPTPEGKQRSRRMVFCGLGVNVALVVFPSPKILFIVIPPRIRPVHMHWKHRTLTTGPPGNFPHQITSWRCFRTLVLGETMQVWLLK